MTKRILVTSTDLMMVQFLVPHIKNLSVHGYEVDLACSDVGGRMAEVKSLLEAYTSAIHIVRLVRSPVSLTNLKGYRDMKQLLSTHHYDVIWTNEPVMGVVTRLAARQVRKQGTKVIYMVHGFHFYKGAPFINWLLFYPIEKFMGRVCDAVITVNLEDYARAQKMKLPDVRYVHGIGINTSRLKIDDVKTDIRQELGLSPETHLVISVGELNKNKNQKTIIKAIAKLNDINIHYILCGKGDQLDFLKQLSRECQVEKQVHFLGYRTDVLNICQQANVFVMPSYREGLPVASLEAMYCGLPLVTSRIRGLVDVMEDGISGYTCHPDDVEGFASGINKILKDQEAAQRMAQRNSETVKKYCVDHTVEEIVTVINQIGKDQ